MIHFSAQKRGVKSLYYLRSLSIQRAEVVSHNQKITEVPIKGKINEGEEPYGSKLDYD